MNYNCRLAIFYESLHAMRPNHSGVSSIVEAGDDRVFLDAIRAEPTGRGLGTGFMRDLTALLDRHRLTMELEAVAEGGEADTTRLRAWYARFRFTPVGQVAMLRRPRRQPRTR